MNKGEYIPVIAVSVLLLLYSILILTGNLFSVVEIIFLISPFAVVWLVYRVIILGRTDYPELKENEEWGYSDKE